MADRFLKKNTMAVFICSGCFARFVVDGTPDDGSMDFAMLFGFAMGADYMLVPLVTRIIWDGVTGKLLALIISDIRWDSGARRGSLGKYLMRVIVINWLAILAVAGMLGAAAIYAIRVRTQRVNA